jgi:hypothetical protein
MIFRWLILLFLLGAAVSFAAFVVTGDQRFKRYGLIILKWTVVTTLVFFAVLALQRIA